MIEVVGFILAALVGVMIGINLNKFKIERKNLKQQINLYIDLIQNTPIRS